MSFQFSALNSSWTLSGARPAGAAGVRGGEDVADGQRTPGGRAVVSYGAVKAL